MFVKVEILAQYMSRRQLSCSYGVSSGLHSLLGIFYSTALSAPCLRREWNHGHVRFRELVMAIYVETVSINIQTLCIAAVAVQASSV